MRKFYFAVLCLYACATAQAQFSIRSLLFRPPTQENNFEYFEVQGPVFTTATNVWLLVIEGDDDENPGLVRNAFDLSSVLTQDNGIVLVRSSAFPSFNPSPDPETTTQVYTFSPALQNGTTTFLLVNSFTGAVGNDLDSDNNGSLESTPWTSIYSAVSVSDGGASDFQYAAAVHPSGGVDFPTFASLTTDAIAFNSGSYVALDIVVHNYIAGAFQINHAWNGAGTEIPEYTQWSLTPGRTLGALPVKLRSFFASNLSNRVELKWASEVELNSQHFELERSLDGRNFTRIGQVMAAGSSHSLRQYNFTDIPGKSEAIYYRLKMVDLDGSFEYSRVARVKMGSQSLVINNLYPRPAGSEVTIEWNSREKSPTQVLVRDIAGRILQRHTISSEIGFNQYQLSLQRLPAGQYLVQLQSGDLVLSEPLIKY